MSNLPSWSMSSHSLELIERDPMLKRRSVASGSSYSSESLIRGEVVTGMVSMCVRRLPY